MVGVLVICAALLLRPKSATVTFPLIVPTSQKFPLESRLAVIQSSLTLPRMITLRKLAEKSPNGILVNFWATWCPPCLEEMPSLEYFHRKIKGNAKLPQLITLSIDEKPQEIFALFRTLDYSVSFTVLHDPLGELSRRVGTSKFPETYWVSPQGEIKHKWAGPQNWLGSEVLSVLASQTN